MERDLAEAAARWNADHLRPYPRSHGTCPVCGGRECWGALGDEPGRWVCFDTDHARVGVQGRGCWHGDALDLEAHARGVRRADVLRADGYLDGAARPAPRRAAAPPPRLRPLPELRLLGAPMAPGWAAPALRWPSRKADIGTPWLATWRALEAFIRAPLDLPPGPTQDDRKGRLAIWSPTVRLHCSRAEGSPVLAVSALVLDLDAVRGPPTKGEPDLDPARLRTAMEELLPGLAWLAHTSPSSTPECWRWRVVLPFAEPVDPSVHDAIAHMVRLVWHRAGRTALEADPAATSARRIWYQPARQPEDPAAYVAIASPGDALDVRATFAALED